MLMKKQTKKPSETPNADAGNQYARDIVSGKIPACKLARLACQRHLDDMAKSRKAGYPYRFNAADAEHVCNFVQQFQEIKGPKAGQNLRLAPWQQWVISSVFGWVSKKTGARRFRTATCFVPRGNGKSTVTAPIGLYMLSGDEEQGAEVYSAAVTRDQARLCFDVAQNMAKRNGQYLNHCKVGVGAHNIHQIPTASKFEALSADARTLDGLNVHFAILDELAAHKNRGVYDVMVTATAKRNQSLIWNITTCSAWLDGIGYEQYTYLKKLLEGTITDDSYFGVFYSIDDDDDPWTESSWIKANPNWGISVMPDMIRNLANRAMQMPSQQNAFLQKHLNVWTNADVAWMDMRAWNRCADLNLSEHQFEGQDCFVGLDLASKVDIAAKIKLFERDGHYYVFGSYYLPDDAVQESRNSQYQGWMRSGFLTVTPGAVTDYEYIESDLIDDSERYRIREVAYDPFQATQFSTRMDSKGIPMVEMRPTVLNFSEPMKHMEALVLSGKLHFNGDPVLTWMVSNIVARSDHKDNIYPNKERPENKIDGVVALLMALGRAITNKNDGDSIYESRGLFVL
jgi:phage terminase large subunit-like protein